jgi:hypothetical protein
VVLATDGGDEAIAFARDGCDVPGGPFPIAQRFAQTCDLCPETARVHHEIAPHARDQFLVADDLACMLNEHDQDIERPVTQWERDAVLLDLARGREKPKRPE